MKNTIFRTLAFLYIQLARKKEPSDSLLDAIWHLMKISAGNRSIKLITSEIKEFIANSTNPELISEIKIICTILNIKI